MPLTFADARDAIAHPLDAATAGAVLDLLMAGTLSPEQGAALLAVWAGRGETGIEVAAVVQGLLARSVIPPIAGPVFDLCGTGGSGLTRFNVSTTVAFMLAALGVPVAKHGNKGSARPNGSFDLLDALGVPYAHQPQDLATLQRDSGICFLFARRMHPAVAAVAPMRKLASGRTVFNLAGPLANPCRPARQLVGVASTATAGVVADALHRLDVTEAWVVRGHPGIDELSITGATSCWRLRSGTVEASVITGHHRPGLDHGDLPGGDAEVNVGLFHELLAGGGHPHLRAMVVLNAAAALACWRGQDLAEGHLAETAEVLANGRTAATFARHRQLAIALAG